MNKINQFIVENRLIRRTLVFIFCYNFLKVTNAIFLNGRVSLEIGMSTAYGTFAGLILFILKFYFQGGKDDADND